MKRYISPKIQAYFVEIEQAIANGSVLVKPMTSEDVVSEWEIGNDQENTFTWE